MKDMFVSKHIPTFYVNRYDGMTLLDLRYSTSSFVDTQFRVVPSEGDSDLYTAIWNT